jgi:hypothetical protein
MKKFLVFLIFAPSLLFAQTPFDGTWVAKLDSAQFPTKPEKYLVDKGMYECLTCIPPVKVKADGTDQPVTGHAYYNSVNAHVVDGNTVEIINKKDGKTVYRETDTVSPDGKTLVERFENTSQAKPVTGEFTYTRVTKGPAGCHPYSGSWRVQKANSISENGLTVTFQGTENGLKMSDPNGQSYDAKFDGKYYPIEGDPGHTMVSLKRVGDDTIEETDKRDGKVVGVGRMTVSKDGKAIQAQYTDKRDGTTMKYTMEKQ